MKNTENEKKRGELMLVKLVGMDDMSSAHPLPARHLYVLQFGGLCWWVPCLFLQVGISSEMIKDLESTRPAHLFPNLCLRRVFYLVFFLCPESMSARGNVLKGGENTPVFLKACCWCGINDQSRKTRRTLASGDQWCRARQMWGEREGWQQTCKARVAR